MSRKIAGLGTLAQMREGLNNLVTQQGPQQAAILPWSAPSANIHQYCDHGFGTTYLMAGFAHFTGARVMYIFSVA